MDYKLPEIVKKYKCSVCDHLLSVPPITIAKSKNNNELYKCGRCRWINCKSYSWTRNSLFEEIVQHLSFPCAYPPCTEVIPWGEVEEHEGNCRYKTIKCPLSNDCKHSEEILVDQIGQHLTDKHKDIIKDTAHGWQVRKYDNYIFSTQIENQYFFIYIRDWYKIAVMATRPSNYTKFNIKLKIYAVDNSAVSVDNLPVIPYCSNIDKIETDDFTNNIDNILTDIFSKRNPVYKMYYSIEKLYYFFFINKTVIEDPVHSIEEECGKKEDNISSQLNVDAIKKALTCPCCMTYMTSPIFSCATGHTICSICRSKLEKCPTCQASLDGPRIYTLEEMANDVEVPCQFNIKGCTFFGNSSNVLTHERECSFN